ncbi:NAD(P)H dehydrogenase [Liquorilactobacillus sucicola DSM 21376 = JCM 15457]|uniref:YdeQ (NAD(P)H dehydrogenase) (Quinone) n=1 Tax=Liquorilactobacillus sucicola DSM 21376 = JCM 15457 TaxID=1423806 RepID=A0A023CV19_9LACO|nr:NAD(P)H-dependent oxidoreductase [Liquorilactobacillus sucicola]KRN05637.1 YdeQ (NAD(P)H dehydrogenase) (quinone) [Liquorilactobacillus sucicola DSM 21376 = JCM 15457]GAJ25723.1 NAD(P)H dehydrogenase [Liquorilactobacillus sucicola DSM 21376 = JCM 15457]
MEQTLVIYCHPYDGSFNHAILNAVITGLQRKNVAFQIIDLYAENFIPVYTSAELALFNTGKTLDPLVSRYQKMLKKADRLIFITPVWWNDLPGMLKGFIDKTMKKNFAYSPTRTGISGQLTNIKTAKVLTTSTSPTWYLRLFCGNAVSRSFVKTTLKQLGIKNTSWQNFGRIGSKSVKQRTDYLSALAKQI